MKRWNVCCVLLTAILLSLPVTLFADEPKNHSFALHYGYANMVNGTVALTNSSKSYDKGLRSGMSWDAQYYYRTQNRWTGWGVIYSGFTSKGALENSSDHIFTHYIAPQFGWYILPLVPRDRAYIRLNVGMGYFRHLDNSTVYGKSRRVTGSSFAGNIGLNGVYYLLPQLGISFDFQYIMTNLSKVNIRYHGEAIELRFRAADWWMQLSRLNISGGLSYFF